MKEYSLQHAARVLPTNTHGGIMNLIFINYTSRMMGLRLALAALLLFLLACQQSSAAKDHKDEIERNDNKEFSLITDCRDGSGLPCVIGKLLPGKVLTQLGREGSNYCRATSADSFRYADEASGFEVPLTHINPEKCKYPLLSVVYLRGGDIEYKKEELIQVKDGNLIRKVNIDIRNKKKLIETREGEHRTELSPDLPIVLSVPVDSKNVFIAIFKNKLLPGDKTHVFYSEEKIAKIHGAAKISSAFRINNRFFVHYKFNCSIGCGFRGDFIIEVFEYGFREVFFDSSWST